MRLARCLPLIFNTIDRPKAKGEKTRTALRLLHSMRAFSLLLHSLSIILLFCCSVWNADKHDTNLLHKCLRDRDSSEGFTQHVLRVFNRADDPVQFKPCLVFIADTFHNPAMEGFFFTNDLRIVVEICFNALLNLDYDDKLRAKYLDIIYGALLHTDYLVRMILFIHFILVFFSYFVRAFSKIRKRRTSKQRLTWASCALRFRVTKKKRACRPTPKHWPRKFASRQSSSNESSGGGGNA